MRRGVPVSYSGGTGRQITRHQDGAPPGKLHAQAYAKLVAASAGKQGNTSASAGSKIGRKQRRHPRATSTRAGDIKSLAAPAPTKPEDDNSITTAGVHAPVHQLAAATIPWRCTSPWYLPATVLPEFTCSMLLWLVVCSLTHVCCSAGAIMVVATSPDSTISTLESSTSSTVTPSPQRHSQSSGTAAAETAAGVTTAAASALGGLDSLGLEWPASCRADQLSCAIHHKLFAVDSPVGFLLCRRHCHRDHRAPQ